VITYKECQKYCERIVPKSSEIFTEFVAEKWAEKEWNRIKPYINARRDGWRRKYKFEELKEILKYNPENREFMKNCLREFLNEKWKF
jgi:adenosyl cobinamide kinase/adenosyl cobinamide phosphate guanylyltransferase